MKLLHISAMGLCAVTLAAAYGCSSSETERNPIFVDAAGGSKASGGGSSLGTGGKASGGTASLGSGGKASGGAAPLGSGGGNSASGGNGSGGANNGSGGANNGSGGANNGSGGANNSSGGANNGSGGANNAACAPTAAGVAAMLATHGCNTCHGQADTWTTTDNLVANAVGVEDTEHATCAGGNVDMPPLIVRGGSPMMSTLYLKLAGTTCGDQMPNGGTPISASELKCVSDWITATPAPVPEQ